MSTDYPISFPGLHLTFNIPRLAFSLFGGRINVYWYGLIIVTGLVLAFIYAVKRAKQFKITIDDLTDVALWSMIFAIVGARLYYVIFFKDMYNKNTYLTDPLSILYLWNGGLAIYGGIIGAFVTAIIVCRHKKQNPLPYFDLAALGFLIGQSIGRWGNFINREAYGGYTTLPWRMVIDDTSIGYHPCFLYESLWCALGFLILHFYSKRRRFDGEVFLMYAAWYSFERFFIEGMRLDSLMIGSFRVSQLLSALVFLASVFMIIYVRAKLYQKKLDAIEYTPVYSDILGRPQGDGTENEDALREIENPVNEEPENLSSEANEDKAPQEEKNNINEEPENTEEQ